MENKNWQDLYNEFYKETMSFNSKLDVRDNSLSIDEITNLFHEYDALVEKFSSVKSYFPSFTLKKAQESLQNLEDRLRLKKEQCLPRKTFTFSSKKRQKEMNTTPSHTSIKSKPICLETAKTESLCFTNESDRNLQLTREQTYKKDIQFQNLSKCQVLIYGTPSSININKCENCEFKIGPVSGPVLINYCRNCNFYIYCHQLRIHTTKKCSFNVHLASKGIIESCSDLIFSQYNWKYEAFEKDLIESGLDPNQDYWNSINDFNWLSLDKPSPNWKILNK